MLNLLEDVEFDIVAGNKASNLSSGPRLLKIEASYIGMLPMHRKSPCRRRWSFFLVGVAALHFWAFLRSFARRRLKNLIYVGDRSTGSPGFLHA